MPATLVNADNDPRITPWVSQFYQRRGNRLAWCGLHGPLRQADLLLDALRRVQRHGLDPETYHCRDLETALAGWRGPADRRSPQQASRLVELDLRLTRAFLLCASHMREGRVKPDQIAENWRARVPPVDLAALLQTALDRDQVPEALDGLRPPQPEYSRLQEALGHYREMAGRGGWPRLPDGGRLEKGREDPGVPILRELLASAGDWEGPANTVQTRFDEELAKALRRFQKRHGLKANGRVDEETRQALAVPIQVRITQLEANLERWRWLPRDRGTRYILVRLSDYALEVVEAGATVMSMKAIVGKPYWRTPVFSCAMRHVVFNPYWYVPPGIAAEEVLPELQQDPGYLEAKGMQVVEGQGDQARVVDPAGIAWSTIAADQLTYGFMQSPGPQNPLGRIKFVFPNPYDVYLHDTPERGLFARQVRDFSHGCVRLEKCLDLAVYVLGQDPKWTRESIQEAMDADQTLQVDLPEPIPVYLLYWTAWVAADGKVQLRSDPYDLDRRLQEALEKSSN